MTLVHALRCDALHVPPLPPPSPYAVITAAVSNYQRDRVECTAVSRAARDPKVLDTLTARDGWITRPDGTHLCPEHAAAEKETAAA